jgi:ribosome-associated protein
MQENLIINDELIIPASELHISATKSQGPGGQHVNTTNSCVQLHWNIKSSQVLLESQRQILLRRLSTRLVKEEELVIQVDSERSQLRNKALACERLIYLVRQALVPIKKRLKTKTPKFSKMERLENKKKRSVIKKLRRLHVM